MSGQGGSNPLVSDSAMRILLQRFDAITATLKDTQMRLQKLEEDKAEASVQTALNKNNAEIVAPPERPWMIPTERDEPRERAMTETSS